jgi:UDP-glucose 4-epimerase
MSGRRLGFAGLQNLKALVTGAAGFLGRSVVAELLRRGHSVRAVVRPSTTLENLPWHNDVDFFLADLRNHPDLCEAFDGIDVIFHLAAVVNHSGEPQFAGTAVGTERLLEAMKTSDTRRIVFASSFCVYDWLRSRGAMHEDSPLESRLFERDEYTIAKTWQERLVVRAAEENGWQLTVLRPGFLWGRGQEWACGAGILVGKWLIINGPFRRLPLTHVENCAHCFVTAAENKDAIGEVFNVVDSDRIRAWRFNSDFRKYAAKSLRMIWIPYSLGFCVAIFVSWVCRWVFGPAARLPGILIPIRYAARFKSLHFPNAKLYDKLRWQPPLTYEQCLDGTYGNSISTTGKQHLPAVGVAEKSFA